MIRYIKIYKIKTENYNSFSNFYKWSNIVDINYKNNNFFIQ